MSSQLIDYADYHRTIIGFHGTSEDAAERLLAGEDFRASDRDDGWFGQGIYFWEHAPKQAWKWAKNYRNHSRPAVVGAVIRLGDCFDLVDPGNVGVLKSFYGKLVGDAARARLQLPQNTRHQRRLGCAVFNAMYNDFDEAGQPLDTARAVYVPTEAAKRVWKGSWISDETHIQICVRNPESIIAVWHVREDGRYGKSATGGGG